MANEIFDIFLKTIEEYSMIQENDRVLVGLSGGRDSMLLVNFLIRYRKKKNFLLEIAHVNHMVRGDYADRDQEFVENFARENGIEFHCLRKNMDEYAREKKLSAEEAGRELRYDFFYRLNPDKIAVAHNADDQAETILMRLIRGTGIKGLGGIPYKNEKIIRPILDIDRSKITEYMKKNNLKYVDDHTNFENSYQRNKIRNTLLPYIEENYNPNFKEALNRLGAISRQNYLANQKICKAYYEGIVGKKADYIYSIDTEKFKDIDDYFKYEVLKKTIEKIKGSQEGISKINLDSVLNLFKSPSGKRISFNGVIFYRSFDKIYVCKEGKKLDFIHELKMGQNDILEIKKTFYLELFDGKYKKDKNIFYLSLKDGEKLYMRNRRPKDIFRPLKFRGKKKLKDYFIEKKIPSFMRDQVPLLLVEDDIAWICGYEIGKRYQVEKTNETDKLLKITMEEYYD